MIQVVSRAFDVLRCFEGHEARLGNLEISNRCGLPRSTVSRLTHTLTRMGQLVYLPRDQKYRIGPSAVAMSTSMMRGLAASQSDPAAAAGCRRTTAGDRRLRDSGSLPSGLSRGRPRPQRTRLELHRGQSHRDREHGGRPRLYRRARRRTSPTRLLAEMEREIPESAKLLRSRFWRAIGDFCASAAMSSPADCGVRTSTV